MNSGAVMHAGVKEMSHGGGIKAAAALLVLLLAAVALGTLIPQKLEPLEYVHRFGERGAAAVEALNLNDLYHAPWFSALFALLGLLLAAALPLRRHRREGWWLLQLGLLAILAGAAAGALWGQRGLMPLQIGEGRDFFFTSQGTRSLPFRLCLEENVPEWDPEPKHRLVALVRDREIGRALRVQVGGTYKVPETDYRLRVDHYVSDYDYRSNLRGDSYSGCPMNPALQVTVFGPNLQEERWLYANDPRINQAQDDNLELYYQLMAPIRGIQSQLLLCDGERMARCVLGAKQPLTYRGYRLYQARVDALQAGWTEIEVVKDPGRAAVYTGFLLLNLGAFRSLTARREKRGRRIAA